VGRFGHADLRMEGCAGCPLTDGGGRDGALGPVGGYEGVVRGAGRDFPHRGWPGRVPRGGARVGLEAGLPVVYGVVTADNTEQAGSGSQQAGNRGRDAALVAVEMATFLRALHPEIA